MDTESDVILVLKHKTQTQFFHAHLAGGYLTKDRAPQSVASFSFTTETDGALQFVSNHVAFVTTCSYRVQLLLDGNVIEQVDHGYMIDGDGNQVATTIPAVREHINLGIATSHACPAGTHTLELGYGTDPSQQTTNCPDGIVVYANEGTASLEVVTPATSS